VQSWKSARRRKCTMFQTGISVIGARMVQTLALRTSHLAICGVSRLEMQSPPCLSSLPLLHVPYSIPTVWFFRRSASGAVADAVDRAKPRDEYRHGFWTCLQRFGAGRNAVVEVHARHAHRTIMNERVWKTAFSLSGSRCGNAPPSRKRSPSKAHAPLNNHALEE
jgi:hypothetical protein